MNYKKLVGKRVKIVTDNYQEKSEYEGILTGTSLLYSIYTLVLDEKILISLNHIVSLTVLN